MNRRNRVGKLTVLRRRFGVGHDVGRVYEARDEETGSPAVLVAPGRGDDWGELRGWRVTLQASAEPRRMSLRVDRAPQGGTLAELSTMLLRFALVVGDLARRRGAREHLTRPHRRLRPVVAVVLPAALAVAAVVALVLVPLRVLERPELPPKDAPQWFTLTGGALPMAPMPSRPFERQKRPPCDVGLEDEIAGGCWTRLNLRAPCPARSYERAGQCYLAALAEPPPGRSVVP